MKAQTFTKILDIGRNLKNYHTVIEDQGEAYYMAGTYFNPVNPELTNLHFVQLALDGTMLNSVMYDVPNHDERCVAFLNSPYSGNKVLVGLLRDNLALTTSPLERIKILEVTNTGNIVKDFVVQNNNPTAYRHIYPMDAIMNDQILYVCGFVTSTSCQYQPDFFEIGSPSISNNKAAFVMMFDMSTGTIIRFMTYDFLPAPASSDFDMAMRLKIIDVSGTSRLFVTGSCNVEYPYSTPPNQFGAGTMNLLLDLGTLGVISSNPFATTVLNNANLTTLEYGFDIQPEVNGQGFFIFGNSGSATNVNPNPNEGFRPFPSYTWVNYVNQSLLPSPPVNSRIAISQGDFIWGTHTLQSAVAPDHIVLAGYYTFENQNFDPMPSLDNVNPFLADIQLSQSGGNNTSTVPDFKVYLSQLGTLTYGTGTSFLNMGGGLSTPAWQPKFATRRRIGVSTIDDIFMYAPSKSFLGSYLTTKIIRTDPLGNVPSCYDSYGIDEPQQSSQTPSVCSSCSTVSATYSSVLTPNYPSYEIPQVLTDEAGCDIGVYRSGHSNVTINQSVKEGISMRIVPNPVQSIFRVYLNASAQPLEQVRIVVMDMLGHSVKTIFDGEAQALLGSKEFDIRDLDPGIYLVQASIGDQSLAPLKLIKD